MRLRNLNGCFLHAYFAFVPPLVLVGASSFALSCGSDIGAPASAGPGAIDPATGQPTGVDPVTGQPLPADATAAPGGASTPGGVAASCTDASVAPSLGRTPLRRLTRDQLDNTLRDLLGTTGSPASGLSPDERIGPFASNSISPTTDLIVQQQQELAASVATEAMARMPSIAPCDLTAGDALCAAQFVSEFGLRAFRRPLTAAEQERYLASYQLGAQVGAPNGFRLLVESMLQSPFFLYHVDTGQGGTPSATPVPLTSYELASRLSYFLWNSLPDAELFGLAADGSLTDQPGVLEAQVQRLLQNDKALDAIPLFHLQWLGLEGLPELAKDPTFFPGFNDALATAMENETVQFVDYLVRRGDGLMSTLFTANFSFLEGPLFQHYGVTQPAGFVPGQPVTLDGPPRAGILTQGAFLAQHAHPGSTSPVVRGIVVRENLLCLPIPSPPANVNTSPPPPTQTNTTRERFAQHEADPSCGVCHQLFDPIGLSFEHYDAVGAYRETENGFTIDASGTVAGGVGSLGGTFTDVLDLGRKLAESQQAADCLAAQWFRYALRRVESVDDACSFASILGRFQASGGSIPVLLASIATSDAFRNVRSVGASN